jgi:fructokinase
MRQSELFPLIQREVQQLLNGYIQAPELASHIKSYIVPPALGERAGVLGALALAMHQS